MKQLRWIAPALAVALVAGCNNDSDTGAAIDREETTLGTATANGSGPRVEADTNAAGPLRTSSAEGGPLPPPGAPAADNTGRNVRDRDEAALTPMDQGRSAADLDATRRIRQALTDSDALSANAQNIKVITQNGQVTLRGPVNSSEEVRTIELILKDLGFTSVRNEMEIRALNE